VRLATLIALIAGALMLSCATASRSTPSAPPRNCGRLDPIKPVKQLWPPGCVDICKQCKCKADESDCFWIWVCCDSSSPLVNRNLPKY
jgi:hypothetical protein